jgi:hypothetical protein
MYGSWSTFRRVTSRAAPECNNSPRLFLVWSGWQTSRRRPRAHNRKILNDVLYVLLTTFKETEGNDIQLHEPPRSEVLCAADKDARGEDERPAQDYL